MTQRTWSADTPVRETPAANGNKAMTGTTLAAIFRAFTVFRATLREIFDESAYQRFLDRRQLRSSPNAYETFRKENEQSKSRRPKCC